MKSWTKAWMKFSRITGITMVIYQYWDDNHSQTHTHVQHFTRSFIHSVRRVCLLSLRAPQTTPPFMKNSKIEVESMMFLRSTETETCCSSMWVDVCVYGIVIDTHGSEASLSNKKLLHFSSELSQIFFFFAAWLASTMANHAVAACGWTWFHCDPFYSFRMFFVGFCATLAPNKLLWSELLWINEGGPTRAR